MSIRMRLAALTGATLLAIALLAGSCSRSPADPTWRAVRIPTDADFTGIWFADSLDGWLAGGGFSIEGGILGRTRDGGLTWRFESGILPGGGDRSSLHRLHFRDTLRGIAACDAGLILLTEDGGATWRETEGGRWSGRGLFDVQFLSERLGWGAGPSIIVSTRDGGATWGALAYSTAENGYLSGNAIHFVDERRGWLAGRDGRLMRSDDGGVTWTQVPLPLRADARPTFWDLTFLDERTGWVVGEGGTILHTRDGGSTWVQQDQGVPVVRVPRRGEAPRPREVVPELETEPDRLALSAVAFADAEHGWAVGYYADVAESVVLTTADGGDHWRTEHVEPGQLLRALFVLDRDHAWAAGDRPREAPQVVLVYGRDRDG